ncbi:uncharacterized protein LOC143247818 isoform X2 [Tachypleus tridentatus]|uniref:uncharacterized protein LOC143247818 isoform X2 n=1 Tax=Tachypleus tridentatus TaxID=6853 RepID=UPI003FCFA9BB
MTWSQFEYIVHLTTEPSKTEVFTYPNHLQIIFGNYVWMVSLQQGYSVHITCGKENYSLCVAGPAKAVSNVCSLMQSACDNAIKADIHHLERFSVSKNKELDTQLISAVRNLFRISIDIKRYKYFPDRLKEILLSWVTQAFKVSNNSQTCQDLLSSSANSSSSFNKKDDSVVIIEDTEKYGHSKNISVVEIESDDSVSDVQECCAQSSQPIKNTAKKTLSAYTSEKGKDTRNPIIDVDSDDSVSEIQFVKVALTDKRKVVKYKKCNKINYNKGRCITRRKQRTLYNSSMKVHKFKTSTPRNFNRTLKILRKYCRKKQPTRVWKSFRNESRFNSTVPVNNAKSCNNLEDRPRVQLTLNNLKDTVISRTVSMETNHSLSCDCCKIVYNGKHYRYIDKDQEESLFSEKLVQNNPVVSGTSSQGKCISAGVASPVQRRRLRPIVIDGSNVAITHGKPKNVFSCRGIELCINFFSPTWSP